MLRVVIAEDAVLLREGLAQLLDRFGHQVIATAQDAPGLRAAVQRDRPDIIVTDVRMPPTHTDEGLRAAIELRQRHPGLPVLVLSQYTAHAYAATLLASSAAGGVGYLLKDRIGQVADFVGALEQVAAGGCVIDPEVVTQLLSRRRDPLAQLTPREREVLGHMAGGKANQAIARELVVSEAAVAKHINSIFAKLKLDATGDDHRRVRAVLAYLESGG
ncbi:DNA-binding response regulator [Rhizocola hellebori]|uniref:DNA-binding response regulator n=1 Tax=Rhizocola hellebori TaxID=1392758 RepID=A0A8J3QEZ4_9ACTN|nr:response regulator transcription factor [Rhizocola hellebori]GIH09511.1 DNA-binding response regulator [Rhizocola hellebori]